MKSQFNSFTKKGNTDETMKKMAAPPSEIGLTNSGEFGTVSNMFEVPDGFHRILGPSLIIFQRRNCDFSSRNSFASKNGRLLVPLLLWLVAVFLNSTNIEGREPQSIVFPDLVDRPSSAPPFALGASATSGLAIDYEIVSSPANATVFDGVVTLTGSPGSVTVKAVQTGDQVYEPALPVFRTFLIGKEDAYFVDIAASVWHSAGIRSDSTLWTWGRNNEGQLGDGTTTTRYLPVQVGSDLNWESVSCGERHTVAIRTDGTLWTWGSNTWGQLGDGTGLQRFRPVQIGTATNWKIAECGSDYTLALRDDGTLWGWGLNSYGALGDGTTGQRNSPVRIGAESDWIAIACGAIHSMGIRNDGGLWAWGMNAKYALGDGTQINRMSPTRVSTISNCKEVACGSNFTIAILNDGSLWAWGDNYYGQLGDGSFNAQPLPVRIGISNDWTDISCCNFSALFQIRRPLGGR